jgi:hypothetical protein
MVNTKETRLEWLKHLIDTHSGPDRGKKARFAAAVGKAPAQISQWLGGTRSIEDETAREIEKRLGLPRWTMDAQVSRDSGPPSVAGVAHPKILDEFTVPPLTQWEDLMKMQEMPEQFRLAVPDDALGERLPKGTELIMQRASVAKPGQVVLVRDGAGQLYLRRYSQGAAGAWRARAPNEDYPSLDSQGDQLQLLGVLKWVDAEGL